MILEEAGGRFTSMRGEAGFEHGSGLGTNGLLHDELVQALRPHLRRRLTRDRDGHRSAPTPVTAA